MSWKQRKLNSEAGGPLVPPGSVAPVALNKDSPRLTLSVEPSHWSLSIVRGDPDRMPPAGGTLGNTYWQEGTGPLHPPASPRALSKVCREVSGNWFIDGSLSIVSGHKIYSLNSLQGAAKPSRL